MNNKTYSAEPDPMNSNGRAGCKPDTGEVQRAPETFFRVSGLLFYGARLLLGAVFLYAAYDKILHPMEFAKAVYNYQILPDALVNLAGLVLPWLELLIGLCLLTGFWLPGATLISTGLLTVFISALAFNLVRGLDVHCGCFSTDATGAPADIFTVLRDGFFLALAGYLFVKVFLFRARDPKSPEPESFHNPGSTP